MRSPGINKAQEKIRDTRRELVLTSHLIRKGEYFTASDAREYLTKRGHSLSKRSVDAFLDKMAEERLITRKTVSGRVKYTEKVDCLAHTAWRRPDPEGVRIGMYFP